MEEEEDSERRESEFGSKKTKNKKDGASKSKTSGKKRKHSPTRNDEGNKKKPCWICEGLHRPDSCFLALGIEPKRAKIPEESKETFEKKMKEPAFAKKIREIRDAEKKKKDLMNQ
jgi:hypothetical protein